MQGTPEEQALIKEFLRRKPVRTISGVAVIAVMTSPAPPCPHGGLPALSGRSEFLI